MTQPVGFEDPNQAGMVCKLRKALYGLRQSSRVWNYRFNSFLNAYSLISASADGCVYCSTTIPRLIITIFVDDGMAICVKNNCMDTILSYMGEAFKITTGYPEVYVGFHIVRVREQKTIYIDQTQYILSKLKKYGFDKCSSVSVPADPNSVTNLSVHMTDGSEVDIEFPYAEVIGSLQFSQLGTRFDISYAVAHAAKFTSRPTIPHVNTVKRILKYLQGTSSMRITYSGRSSNHLLEGFCDADYAMDLDNRKSRSGFILT